jgi:hypothetical protein
MEHSEEGLLRIVRELRKQVVAGLQPPPHEGANSLLLELRRSGYIRLYTVNHGRKVMIG